MSVTPEKIDMIKRQFFGPFYDYMDPELGHPFIIFEGYVQSIRFPGLLAKIRPIPVDKEDVYVTSFPKSGTTWMQNIVWGLVTQKFDSEESMDLRFPELEIPPPYPPKPENLDVLTDRKPPRMYKSHLPLEFLPRDVSKAKLIYVYRNPKDTIVSYFHYSRALVPQSFAGTFEEFVNLFLEDRLLFGPWWKHVKGYYNASKKSPDHVMMIAFEDLKRDRLGCIRKIAKFLGRGDLPEEVIQKVNEESSFEAMKKNPVNNYSWLVEMGLWNPDVTPFVRKGAVGDWKNHFTPELQKKLDDYMAKHMSDCDLKFED